MEPRQPQLPAQGAYLKQSPGRSPETMPRYIYLTVGTEDPWCIKSTQYYGEIMDEKGIPNQNDLVEGYDHGNDLWELGHYNFLQKIFRD